MRRVRGRSRMGRLFGFVVCVLFGLFAGFGPVLAVDQLDLDPDRLGSLTLTSGLEESSLSGLSFAVYQVADIVSVSGPYEYAARDEFGRMNLDVSQLENADYVTTVGLYIEENDVEPDFVVKCKDASVTAPDLSVGLYYVSQVGGAEAEVSIEPFLVTIPGEDLEGHAVYDVTSYGKAAVSLEPGGSENPEPTPDPGKNPPGDNPDTQEPGGSVSDHPGGSDTNGTRPSQSSRVRTAVEHGSLSVLALAMVFGGMGFFCFGRKHE